MMSEIFFTDSNEAPVPPDEVRIRTLEAEPRPDGRRIDVRTALTPFQQRPNIEISIRDKEGREVSTLSVVEAIDAQMDFTMHLRGPQGSGRYTMAMRVFYADIESHEAAEGEEVQSSEILQKAAMVVDEAQTAFDIPAEN
jgi:hypothetical protein